MSKQDNRHFINIQLLLHYTPS